MPIKDKFRIVHNGGQAAPVAPDMPAPTADIPRPPGQAWVEERTRVAVSRGVNVSGRLVFSEPVRIEGRFRGEVRSADLVVISTEGSLDGGVHAPRLLVLGELRGDIHGAQKVVLGPRARVNGRIEVQQLTICEGARFDGYIAMLAARAEIERQPNSA
jgi:cytoskeletal protein CcmA (bactofilin family)